MPTKEQIFNFIGKQSTAFIASLDQEGFPNMKAMLAPRKIEGNCFYFTTNTSSLRVSHYQHNNKASIYFYNRKPFRYKGVMLVGTMAVLQDADIKREIWRKGDTVYYKLGVTDPDYCVLKFTASSGRYYCNLETQDFLL